jgi:PPP family 3-phenylpropionic acid transporter
MKDVDTKPDQELRTITLRFNLFYFFLFFGFGAYLPLLSLYLKSYGLSGTQIGLLLAVGPIISILAQPMWGMISDRYQAQRKVLVFTLTASTITGLLYPAVGGRFVWLLLLYLVLMLFQSAIVPIMDAMALSHVQKSTGDYGSIRMYGALGFALAVWVSGQLAEWVGLTAIFYLYGFAFMLCILIVRTLPQEDVRLTTSVWSGLGKLLRIPQYVLFLLAAFLIFGPINANNSYFSLFYTSIGGAVAGVGLAFLLFAGSEAPVMRVAGRFINRFGMLPIVIFSGIVAGIRWLYYANEPSPGMVLVFFFLQGLSVGLFLPTAARFIREHTPQDMQVTAQAIYAALGNGLGTVVASSFAGVLFDRYGILSTYQYFAVSSMAGSLLLLVLYLRQQST